MKNINGRAAGIISAALFWLLVWEAASLAVGSSLIFPGPVDTIASLVSLTGSSDFYISLGRTLIRVFGGVILSVVLGILFGILSGFCKPVYHVVSPAVSVVRSLPVVSVIILLNLWLKSGIVPLAVTFFVCFPITWTNVVEGIRSTDPLLIEMAGLYRVPLVRQLRDLYLPSLRPYITASVMNAVGMGWKSTVTAEVLAAARPSVGMNLYYSKLYLETPQLFAWTVALVICSMLIEQLIKFLMKRCWKTGES